MQIHTFGYTTTPIDIVFDKVYDIHLLGAKLFDHNGRNNKIKESIIKYIIEKKPKVLGIQCQYGKHRSMEMATDIYYYFICLGWKVMLIQH